MNGRWLYYKWQYPLVQRMFSDASRAQEIQWQVLQDKLRMCGDSRFGRDHKLSSIRSVEDFRRQIPVTDFEYFRPYVDDVRNGKIDALFSPSTKLLMFALTSGTTDKAKHIPVTRQFVDGYKRGWKIWGLKTHHDHQDLLTKKYLHLASDWQQEKTPGGIWCGNISGLAAETRPLIVRRPFVLPHEVSRTSDWMNRQYVILRLALAQRQIGMIITANPLTLVKLAELADAQKESLLRDMRDGTLTLPVEEGAHVPSELTPYFRPADNSRCQELEQIVERSGKLLPSDAWPGLSVIAVWMGGPVSAFVPQVRDYYGDAAFRDHGLSASEGRMTIPMDDESNAGMLDYQSNFYEFIPVDEYESSNPTVLGAHELEQGKSYYILLTNSGGLFRYDIRDIVRCAGFEGRVPLLEFLHKGAHCANVAGEKLTEYQVATAIRSSFSDLGRNVETVMLAPVMGTPPQYVLLIEENARDYGDQLAHNIDRHLATLNCEYDDRLKSRRLEPIKVQQIPGGSWERLRKQKIASRGGSQEQYKHAFLGDIDEINRELSA